MLVSWFRFLNPVQKCSKKIKDVRFPFRHVHFVLGKGTSAQHESTVWLLMSYFACGSMSQLLSESNSSDMLVVSRISWLLMCGINFAKSPSTFACFCDSMKAMINSKCAILPSEQRLVYNTTLLEDSVLLADFLPEALRSYKAQILQLNKTWQKLQTTSSRNGHHLYYEPVALKSFTSGCDGWFVYGSNKTSRWRLEFTRSSWCDVLQQ